MRLSLNYTDKIKSSLAIKLSLGVLIIIAALGTDATLHALRIRSGLTDLIYSLLTDPATGHASTLGWGIFTLVVFGLPLIGILNLLTFLKLDLRILKSGLKASLKISPLFLNILLAAFLLSLAAIFDGHLLIDSVSCSLGNVPACD